MQARIHEYKKTLRENLPDPTKTAKGLDTLLVNRAAFLLP